MRPPTTSRSEKGIALVVALLVLLVMSMLAIVLMTSVTVESKITGHNTRSASALNIAEAGIAEALSQIKVGNVDLANPNSVYQIFNVNAGSVPTLGADSTALPTLQPAGQWLDYTSATPGPKVLTIEYRTNPARTQICKYDPNANPAIQYASGYPIYRVTATGIQGNDERRVVAEFIRKPMNVLAMGAMVADVDIHLSGSAVVCGHNHSINTPTYAGKDGRTGTGGCAEDNSIQHWELGFGDMTGMWTTGTGTAVGSSEAAGPPGDSIASNQTGFYAGPWEVFDLTQSQFYAWVGAAQWPPPATPVGIVHVDNNNVRGDASSTVAYHGGDGEGFLYVDGNLSINGNFTYRGMVYVEGDFDINGTVWVLGGLVVKGGHPINIANGTLTVLYSADTIKQKVSQYGGQFVNISWREL